MGVYDTVKPVELRPTCVKISNLAPASPKGQAGKEDPIVKLKGHTTQMSSITGLKVMNLNQ